LTFLIFSGTMLIFLSAGRWTPCYRGADGSGTSYQSIYYGVGKDRTFPSTSCAVFQPLWNARR